MHYHQLNIFLWRKQILILIKLIEKNNEIYNYYELLDLINYGDAREVNLIIYYFD